MKRAKVIQTVTQGGMHIKIKSYKDGLDGKARFGFDVPDPEKPGTKAIKKVRLLSLADCVIRAKELMPLAGRTVLLGGIEREKYEAFLRSEASRPKAPTVPAMVEAFIEMKKSQEAKPGVPGLSPSYVGPLKADLDKYALAFPGQINLVERAAVEAYLNSQHVGPVRWNKLRAGIVSLHKFARQEGAISAELSGPEKIGKKKEPMNIKTYSADELLLLINAVPPQWLPVIILGAFCGLRPHEICPPPHTHKPGLQWKHVLWRKDLIHVPANVAKGGTRSRFAPFPLAAASFLEHFRDKDPEEFVCPQQRLDLRTAKWAARAGAEWLNDGLRHSFASYRLSIIEDVGKLSLEMGNSPSIIFKHYLHLKHKEEGVKWFSLRSGVQQVPWEETSEPLANLIFT